jgi:hypothetical protein
MSRLAVSAVVLLVVSAIVLVSPGAAAKPIKATLVGDSVAMSIDYTPSARAVLRKGMALRLDLAVCRRLVQPSCAFQGTTPSTALEAVQGYGRSLGEVLVVKVGYNEGDRGYGEGIDRVMRAARKQGVKAVVWVTLRETIDIYYRTNLAIKRAARRWPQLRVADWNAYSHGKPWFIGDGLHLTGTGATALATFLRQNVIVSLRSVRKG